jgi:DNA-binding transcriptional regulator PaaX
MTIPDKKYQDLLAEMPPGLDRAILRVVSQRMGKRSAIGRKDLVKQVAMLGFHAHERQVREAIKTLRREGHLICSAPGETGGYWLAENMADYADFEQSELLAKIADMSETMSAMRKSAKEKFNDGVQARLI